MKEYKVEGHASSLLPDNYELELVWSDEFDGKELDRTKWDYRMHMMNRRHYAWSENGVELDGNSNAVFRIFEEDGRIVSSQLQTGYNYMDAPIKETTCFGGEQLQWNIGKLRDSLYTKKYGYFECRCRLQQMEGWWSAFWVQSPIIGASNDPGMTGTELDIMESFHPGQVTPHNAITGGYGQDLVQIRVGGREKEKALDPSVFHTFGLLWDENGYTFYVDGVEDGHIDQYVSHIPEFILISTEVLGYRKEGKNYRPEALDAARAGDTFLVDYVRVFDIKK